MSKWIVDIHGDIEGDYEIIGKYEEQEPCEDAISRQAVLGIDFEKIILTTAKPAEMIQQKIKALPPVTPQQTGWIPVSERLPEDLEPVNITWVNHNPESYYEHIKDKPFTATGVYFNGQWYWWSALCTDILAEYGHNHDDIVDDDIEIIAWIPLPSPCKAESENWKRKCTAVFL